MIKKLFISNLILLLIVFLLSSCQSDQNGRTQLRIGNKQYNKGQYNDSESSYLKSIEKSASPEALYGRGNSSQCLLPSLPSSNLTATDSVALSSYQSALEQTSGNSIKQSKIYHNMGNLCYQAGLRNQKTQHLDESTKKFSESVEYYKSSLRLNPSDDETRYNLCMAIYMLDKNKKDQENQQQNQDQSQNSDKENQDKQQQQEDKNKDQNKNEQEKDKNKKDQENKENSDNSNSNKQENKDKENNEQNKNKDKEPENNKEKENGKEKKDPEKKKENEKENPQNNQSSPSGQNKDKESSASRSKNIPKPKGGIDKKTANQLLNAAQQDENKVQKKIEKAIGVGGSYEKDW